MDQAVLRFLDDAPARLALGEAGRRYVETHHGWESCLAPMVELLLQPHAAAGAERDAAASAVNVVSTAVDNSWS
jgi:hypothetical protein